MEIIYHQELASTNVYAKEQLAKEPSEFTVYVADSQPKGKGQQGNHWESECGKNLTFSVVLYPTFLPIARQFLLSKAVCLGIADVLRKAVQGVKVKWPNDIYVGDQKICGILIENQIRGVGFHSAVVGIGLNVNQEQFLSDAPNPVSLKQLTEQHYNLNDVLQAVLSRIQYYYEQIRTEEAVSRINAYFVESLYRLGGWHKFSDDQGVFVGKIIGINEIGQLLIRHQTNDVVESYHFKEVSYIIRK
ncbi:MAG: biotin--[acetyl-CoA-carboxylase] ligase [Mangrovibacterium sp.]